MNFFILGGSRNIGYYSALRLLAQGHTVTFLLRRPDTFDADDEVQRYISQGKVRLSIGDALVEKDVRDALAVAAQSGGVDTVLFSIGQQVSGIPKISLSKGILGDYPNLVAKSLQNTLSAIHSSLEAGTQLSPPRIIVVSSNGVTNISQTVPLLLRPMYSWLLLGAHRDKLGAERLIHHTAGWGWPSEVPEPREDILASGWRDEVGTQGWLKEAAIIGPALLTDGPCRADQQNLKKTPYRVSMVDSMEGAWTVSRRDVADYIVQSLEKEQWRGVNGKKVIIAY